MNDGTCSHGFMTRLVHAGEAADPAWGAVGVPMYQNATFAFTSAADIDALNAGKQDHYVYSRYGNPTVKALENKIADLEGAEAALAMASGMAVISTAALQIGGSDGHIIASRSLYPVARSFFREGIWDYGVRVSMVDTGDLDAVRAAVAGDTRAIYVETVCNPTMEVMDIPALANIAHHAGALLIVDNTFLSPALYRPIEDGADLVIHSATKYLSGHGNLLGGIAAGSVELTGAMRARMEHLGGVMSPHTAWLLLTGIKTLGLRMAQHSASAIAVAESMAAHSAVEQVNYPGLTSHPEHKRATRMTGGRYSGVISLRLIDHAHARNVFLDELTIPLLAVSLGDVASLVWPFDEDGVIRISVGIEDTVDLVADVRRALDAVSARVGTTEVQVRVTP